LKQLPYLLALVIAQLILASCSSDSSTTSSNTSTSSSLSTSSIQSSSVDISSSSQGINSSSSSSSSSLESVLSCPSAGGDNESALASHQVSMATSTDGVNFITDNSYIIEKASVPDAIIKDNGNFLVYYVNGNSIHQHGIYVSEVTPEGSVLSTSCTNIEGSFRTDAVDPDIRKNADGGYRLCYFGNFGPQSPENTTTNKFYCADSSDGMQFNSENFIHDASKGTDPSITQLLDNTYIMAYACEGKVCLATSSDDITYTSSTTLDVSAIPEIIALSDGSIRLFASSQSYLSHDNGLTWQLESSANTKDANNVNKVYADPSIVKTESGWQLFYKVLTDVQAK